jgi:hypothetical protein
MTQWDKMSQHEKGDHGKDRKYSMSQRDKCHRMGKGLQEMDKMSQSKYSKIRWT